METSRILFLIICILAIDCSSGPRSPGADKAIAVDFERQAIQLANKIIILDGHIDVPYRLDKKMEDISKRTKSGDFDYVRAQKGGLDAPFMSIYVPADLEKTGGAKMKAEELISLVEGIIVDHPEKFASAHSPMEIEANFALGKISLPLGMENGAPIEGDITNVKYFHDRGIRYITLTHSKDNHICDSSYDTARTWNGLSPFGQMVVKEMNRQGIMIDVSHISDSAFYQVMRLSAAPVIASHSSCRHFTPDWERNMSDDMIRNLARNDGVIQINSGSTFISGESRKSWDDINRHYQEWISKNNLDQDEPEAASYLSDYRKNNFLFVDIDQVADHIDHVVKLAGIDFVGLGSDFDGVEDSLPIGLKDVSQYPNLIAELLRRGYTEEDIEKICYKNVFRVWNRVSEVSE